jgi:ankyrin repeat protein
LKTLLGGKEIDLEYAIYHSPLSFVRTLLELGADPDYQDDAGFPSLIAAISTERPDKSELVELLLSRGADIQQRGMNDYTPLHYAAARNDVRLIELLLARGADPNARTKIDDFATPAQEAELLHSSEAVEALRKASE